VVSVGWAEEPGAFIWPRLTYFGQRNLGTPVAAFGCLGRPQRDCILHAGWFQTIVIPDTSTVAFAHALRIALATESKLDLAHIADSEACDDGLQQV
jgi:hypothetical protein